MTEASGQGKLSSILKWRSPAVFLAFAGANLMALRCDSDPAAKAKSKPKAKRAANPKSSEAARRGPEETERNTSDSRPKKRKVDPAAQQRLDQLKLDSDSVRITQKWAGRIKSLNVEVTHSLSAATPFPSLEGPLG